MATTKTKGTNKKIKELKGVKPEKLSSEELQEVQKVVHNINNIQMRLGDMEIKRHTLLHEFAGVQDEMTILQNKFQKEYGTVDINIMDGTINYPENGQTN